MGMRREIPNPPERIQPKFNQAPNRIPEGRSPDDPAMAFTIPDCATKAGGQFATPFVLDARDLPTTDEKTRNKQGF
jgi:hypothetical protein